MTRGVRVGAAVLTIVAGAVLGAPASAAGAVTLGIADAYPGAGEGCGLAGQTLIQVSSPSRSYVAPFDGVLTSWSVHGSWGPSVELKVARPAGSHTYTIVAEDPRTLTTGPNTFPVRLPVRQGDTIALRVTSPSYCPNGDLTETFETVGGDPAVGTSVTFAGPSPGHVPVAAQVEPDADGDGYGDESQDACPSLASVQGACPVPDRSAPDTTITKGPKKKTTSRSATFVFAATEPGSTFECSLDSSGFVPCTSPRKVKVKGIGKHNLLVRAKDAAGNLDTTEAAYRWKVVKKPKR